MEHRTLVLGVELYPYVPAVVGDLYRLDEACIGVLPCADHTCTLVILTILAIELKAVPVSLTDEVCSIGSSNP